MPAKNNKPNSSIRVGTVEIAKIWKSPKKMEPRFSQLDVEEHHHAVYIDRQLQLALSFLTQNGADEEMIDTITYCINGNRSRINTKLLLN